MAANGTPIRAFGKSQREIKIAGISYSFVFIIAQVSRPILGLDFLQTFKMAIDLGNRRILHSGAAAAFTSVASNISGVNVVQTSRSSFERLPLDFPEITDVV